MSRREKYITSNIDVFVGQDTSAVSEAFQELKHHIPGDYLDKHVERLLCDNILPKCSMISVEYPYYDPDYLSTYYIYYIKKFRQFRKECCRIIFFGRDNGRCIGYITLRPVATEHRIGKSYLDPSIFAKQNEYIIGGQYTIHYEGEEAEVFATPYMQQEGAVAVCAHVALWETIRVGAASAQCSNYTMGEIVELVKSPHERKIPSRGLTAEQISAILLSVGFSSTIIRREVAFPGRGSSSNDDVFFQELIAYIDSGIPVICISEPLMHSVLACGRVCVNANKLYTESISHLYEQFPRIYEQSPGRRKTEDTDIIMESELVEGIVVNDDNEWPYHVLSRMPNAQNDSIQRLTNLRQITCCIIPLYHRIQLPFTDAKNVALFLYKKGTRSNDRKYVWRENAHNSTNDCTVMRLYLTTANKYKQWIKECVEQKYLTNEFLALLGIAYPRYVWIAEMASAKECQTGMCSGFIVLDSTCTVTDPNICIVLADHCECEFRATNCESSPLAICSYSFPYDRAFQIPSFRGNYKECRPC